MISLGRSQGQKVRLVESLCQFDNSFHQEFQSFVNPVFYNARSFHENGRHCKKSKVRIFFFFRGQDRSKINS